MPSDIVLLDSDFEAGLPLQRPPDDAPRALQPKGFDKPAPPSAEAARSRASVTDPGSAPWRAVALLNFYDLINDQFRFVAHATGFFVKSDVIVTAAHNLRNISYNSISAFPGHDARRNPVQRLQVLDSTLHKVRDVGVLITKSSGAEYFQLVGDAERVRLAGYAFPYEDNSPQMTSGASEASVSGQRVGYDIDVRKGDSGAPVFNEDDKVIAIHVEGERAGGRIVGVGELMDDNLRSIIDGAEERTRRRIAEGTGV